MLPFLSFFVIIIILLLLFIIHLGVWICVFWWLFSGFSSVSIITINFVLGVLCRQKEVSLLTYMNFWCWIWLVFKLLKSVLEDCGEGSVEVDCGVEKDWTCFVDYCLLKFGFFLNGCRGVWACDWGAGKGGEFWAKLTKDYFPHAFYY